MNRDFRNDLKVRINHVLFLMTKLENKITNVQRKEIIRELKRILERYANTRKSRIHKEVIDRIEKIANNLNEIQRQHKKLRHDHSYYGLRKIKDLFEVDEEEGFTPVLVRQSFKGTLSEYEINGSTKVLTFREYLDKTYLLLKNKLEEIKNSSIVEKKILLRFILVFKKVNNEFERFIRYIDSNGLTLRYGDNVSEFIRKLYDSLEEYEKSQNNLRGSNFVFNSVDLSYLQVVKISSKRGGSYIETSEWIKNKKAIINPQNYHDNKCFAYSLIASALYDEIGRDHNRVSKLKRYMDYFNWNDINFPTQQKDWDLFEENNRDVALNIFSVDKDKRNINNIRVLKFNRNRSHKVVLLMITNGFKWHFTSVKSEIRSFRNVFFSNNGDFYCFNCRQAYRTDKALKKHERLCLNNKHCNVKLPKEEKNITKYEKDMRSITCPHYMTECLLRNINNDCDDIDKDKSYQIKNNLHVLSDYALYLIRSYAQNLLTHYRCTDCMQKFVRAVKSMIVMIGKTKKATKKKLSEYRKYEFNKEETCNVCKKEFKGDSKVKDYCYFTGDYVGACHICCSIDHILEINKLLKSVNRNDEVKKIVVEIPILAHNASNYDNHFVVKELAKEVDGLVCISENSGKYITFSALLHTEEVIFKLKFIESFRFMSSSLQ